MPNKYVVARKQVLSSLLFLSSLIMNLPDGWQDNFVRAGNLKCLTLYPSKDELNLLRKLSRRNKQSISATVRKAVDSYFQNRSWAVNIFPQTALKDKSRSQLSVYLFKEQINKLKYLSSQTNRPVIDLGYRKFGKYVCSGFHELSHSWNVWQFRDHSSGGPWFHDGIANYFEAIGPRDAFGLDQLYRAWLYQAWDFYREKDGIQYDIPLVELEHQRDNGDLNWSLMIYFKGALFYYILDKKFQEAGNNFYDFTTYLYEKFPPDGNPGTVEDFVQSAELFAGKDLTNFFDAYFFGDEDYPLQELDAYETDYQEVFGSHTCESSANIVF